MAKEQTTHERCGTENSGNSYVNRGDAMYVRGYCGCSVQPERRRRADAGALNEGMKDAGESGSEIIRRAVRRLKGAQRVRIGRIRAR